MRKKRFLFVASLIVLFIVCFGIMNQHVDELARYRYADDTNSEIILENLSSDDINYLIDRQLEPDEFMPYLGIENFNIRNTAYYNTALQARSADLSYIVSFVNEFRNIMDLDTLGLLLLEYDYETLASFWRGEYDYMVNASLIVEPSDLLCVIGSNQTLYRFEPKDLMTLTGVPQVNQNENEDIQLRTEAADALSRMCEAAHDLNHKTCGNMIAVEGYVSYDMQEELYENAILRYGQDEAILHEALPGTSENQLGTTIVLVPAQIDLEESQDEMTAQQQWLMDNAYRYGFVLRNVSEGRMQEFVLRYIGESDALQAQTGNLSIEELQ